jgi:hypothetical protein
MGIVVDLEAKTVAAYGINGRIDRVDAGEISFSSLRKTNSVNTKGSHVSFEFNTLGHIDRITGAVTATVLSNVAPNYDYDLLCKPTRPMF